VNGLEVEQLVAGYRGTPVAAGLDLTVRPGEIVGLFGANGAGKTTSLNAMVGILAAESGSVSIDGVRLERVDPRSAANAGLVLVPEDRCLFMQLTVLENLKVPSRRGGRTVDGVLGHFPLLRRLLRRRAGLLSGGEQQMLAIARGLMTDPSVLLIDELSLGLAPIIVERLLGSLRRLADEGLGVLLVEQQVHLALDNVDRGYVLRHGTVALEGSAAELRDQLATLSEAYLGTDSLRGMAG
jgi:branched-chain amino acid transport system ATP-binding protein